MLASMLKPEEPWATPVPCSRLIPITLQQTQDSVWATGGWSTPSPQVLAPGSPFRRMARRLGSRSLAGSRGQQVRHKGCFLRGTKRKPCC